MANKVTIPTKVITGVNTRWSYANVWDPKSINGGAPKYSGITHHSEVRYRYSCQDQGSHSGSL